MNNRLHPSFFSGWLPYVQAFGPSGVALLAAVIAGVITWYWQKRQHRVASAVKDVAATKLRLDLFEKRFAAYIEVLERIQKIRAHSLHDKSFNHTITKTEYEYHIEPIKYLFNDAIYKLLNCEISNALDVHMGNIGQYQNSPDSGNGKKFYNDKTIDSHQKLNGLIKELDKIANPFLKVIDD